MKKKIISMITALACAVCAVGVMPAADNLVSAASYSDYFSYGDYLKCVKVDEDEDGAYDYVKISGCDESATAVEIPAEIDDLPVTKIGDSAFSGCTSLSGIEIPNSVTSIGDDAFSGCTSLSSINIPDSVTEIEFGTFSGCEKLAAINVSSGNNNYASIDGVLFNKDKTKLKQYPAGRSETTYTIPDSVTYIESGAFSGCTSLSSIEIPDSVTYIETWVFDGCTSLSSINIPDSVTYIGDSAFEGCEKLAAINVSSENNNYASIDGVLFNKDKTELKQYPIGRSETYTIPDSVTYIGDSAFDGCTNLSSVEIPDSVTRIGDYAFYECTSLSSINIPDSVTAIGESAFHETQLMENQDGIKYVGKWVVGVDLDITLAITSEIREGTKGIADSAFSYRREDISNINLPEGLMYIGDDAFYGCENLTNISIPDSVMNIGENAFYETQLMENQDGINYVGKWAVGYDEDITSAEIREGTIGIANCAFVISDISGITIPEGLMYIGNSAFDGCDNIYNNGTIEIPASVVRIGDGAFQCNYNSELGFFNIKNPDCVLGKDCMYNAAIFGEENSILQACAEKEGIPFNPVIVTEAGEYNIELAYNSTKDILFCPSESGNYSVRTKSDKAHMTSFGNSTHYSSTYENEVDSQDELTAGKYYMINIDSKLENENFNNWNEGDLPATIKVDIYHVISESKDISELVDYDIPSYVRSDISFNLEKASNVILDISENLKHLIIHFDESGYEKSSEWKSNGIYTLESGSYMLRIYGNDNDAKLNASLTPYTSTTTVTTTSPTTSTTVSTSVSITTDSVSSGTETTPDVTGTTTDSTTVISTDVTTTKASTADTTAGSTSVSTTSTSTSVSATSAPITTTVPPTTTPQVTGILGDANSDGKLDVRDAAYIARMLAQRDTEKLPKNADFNEDGQINVRDAAAIARFLAKKH